MRLSPKRALARFVLSQSSPAADLILAKCLLGSAHLKLKQAGMPPESKNVYVALLNTAFTRYSCTRRLCCDMCLLVCGVSSYR